TGTGVVDDPVVVAKAGGKASGGTDHQLGGQADRLSADLSELRPAGAAAELESECARKAQGISMDARRGSDLVAASEAQSGADSPREAAAAAPAAVEVQVARPHLHHSAVVEGDGRDASAEPHDATPAAEDEGATVVEGCPAAVAGDRARWRIGRLEDPLVV